MTKEELLNLKKTLKLEEDELDRDIAVLSKTKSGLHKKLRTYYQEYVDEHFPFKLGEQAKYTFINNDGDVVTREITITDISGYNCNLNEIVVSYKYNGDKTGTIWNVGINGELNDYVFAYKSKLEKI